MKTTILALAIALTLGVAFIASTAVSVAGPNDVRGNYADERADDVR